MPEALLTILKFCFLALLYLFFVRVLRAVWAELNPRALIEAPSPRGWPGGRRSASLAQGARLKVIAPPEQRGRLYDLGDELTVGRAAGCGVCIEDSYASQLHARVFRRGGQLYVEDLGSTNGTYLNRRKVAGPTAVRRGDKLQVGNTVLEVTR
jgi:pSer/pThr/pTyr-binding forkhead associated (FHA) protein